MASEVEDILLRIPLVFKPPNLPASIDEEDTTLQEVSLPSPLKPEVSLKSGLGQLRVPFRCLIRTQVPSCHAHKEIPTSNILPYAIKS